jgi:predicted alpha/beta superfamily hydrolase/GNAT superfamily N-acetyltransferase
LPHTLTGTFRLHKAFASRFLKNPRDVLVYLPPGYNTSRVLSYPVLYMHDGQNLFDSATAFGGNEWGLDETAERMIEAGEIQPLIIVGIYNTGFERMAEYTHVKDRRGRGGHARAYGNFIVSELKPFIDDEYRTLSGPSNTGMGGSSLGALVSLYFGLRHPGIFGKLMIMSPSVWWSNGAILKEVSRLKHKLPQKIWLDIGTCSKKAGVLMKIWRSPPTKAPATTNKPGASAPAKHCASYFHPPANVSRCIRSACVRIETEDTEMAAAVGPEVLFRSFQAGDEEAFRTLNEAWIEKHFVLEEKDRETLGNPHTHILGKGGHIVIAERAGRRIGCCALIALPDGRFEVAKMTVAESERGQGLGRKLLEYVVEFARERSIKVLYLETNTKLRNAIGIYRAVGFRHLPAERIERSPYARANVYMEMVLG